MLRRTPAARAMLRATPMALRMTSYKDAEGRQAFFGKDQKVARPDMEDQVNYEKMQVGIMKEGFDNRRARILREMAEPEEAQLLKQMLKHGTFDMTAVEEMGLDVEETYRKFQDTKEANARRATIRFWSYIGVIVIALASWMYMTFGFFIL